eukprot:GHVU01095532.1.p1 GENE.GHVU01095532.1~~GHVU01095532.1.p1  ORF type:complete len:157 (+),score=25.45 GHVU01095532.1:64-534(+)
MASSSPGDVAGALRESGASIEGMIQIAKQHINEGVETFAAKKIGCLLPIIKTYVKLMEALNVKTREGVENTCKQNFCKQEVREASEEFETAEKEWNKMLEDVDKSLQGQSAGEIKKLGEDGPLDYNLVNVRTNNRTQLSDYVGQESIILVLLRHFA